MKKFSGTLAGRLLLCLLLLLTLLVHGPARSEERRPVRVAVFQTEPLVWYDAERDRPRGIYVDVLEAAGRAERWSIQYVRADYSRALAMLESGEVDLVPHVPDAVDWSRNYALGRESVVSAWGRVYTRPRHRLGTMRDLADKRIAVIASSALHEYLINSISRGLVSAIVQPWPSAAAAAAAVSRGDADAVILNQYVGALLSQRAGLHASDITLPPLSFRFAARKASNKDLLDALDRTLVGLKSNPDSVYFRSLQVMGRPGEFVLPPWVKRGAALAVVLLLFGGVWAYTLRRAAVRLRESELQQRGLAEELTRVCDRSLDVIAVLDEQFRWVRVSRAAERLWGYTADELVGRCCLELMPAGHERAECRVVLERVLRGDSLQASAGRMTRRDGTTVRMLWSLTSSRDEGRIYAIGSDDSERYELINALKDREVRLTLANRDLRTFAHSISHDLRSPVAAVIGFAGKVLSDDGAGMSPRSVALLGRVLAAGERMEGMIASLLQLARLSECGLRRTSCDVTGMAEQIVEAFRHGEPERDVRISVSPGMKAWADEGLLRHVLENLLANAWKFTARTPQAHIVVACDGTGREPVFSVRDNGAGFDMEFAQQMFRPFSRLHSQDEFKGTGIGLSIAHRVVTGHGGRLWAEGEPGLGAVFRFTLGGAPNEECPSCDRSETVSVGDYATDRVMASMAG